MKGTIRGNIKQGTKVRVVQKQDQRSGKLTEGVVQKILTKSPSHHHGIKVMLESGIVGRVKEILKWIFRYYRRHLSINGRCFLYIRYIK